MRLFRKSRVEDPTEHTNPRLVDAVRALGRRWGATPVALTAAYLSNPQLIRDLISAEARYISFDSNCELAERFADQEGTRRGAINEVVGMMSRDQPPGVDEGTSDLPSATDAAARVGAYLSSFGDGLIDETADSKPLYARDLESLRQDVIHESAGILPSGRSRPPANTQAALVRAGHRIAELQGVINTVYRLAEAAVTREPLDYRSPALREIIETVRPVASMTRGKDDDTPRDNRS